MRCADTVWATTIDALPAAAQALFAEPQDDLFASGAWYRVVLACGMPRNAAAQLLFCGNGAVFPMQTVDDGRGFGSLTTLYSCLYRPLIVGAAGDVLAEFAQACRSHALTRIDALPADWPYRTACIEAARAAGLSVRQFEHFGNWHEAVAGESWTTYLADRPGTLRETVRRKLRRKHRFELITGGDRLEAGIADFESVYQRSWKQPEPFPDFNAALMRALAPLGMLRLGVLHVGGTAAAAQLWVVERHRATVLKLAHDQAFKADSPGTVLTALILQQLLDEEHVPEIDFGRGDDAYKAAWASQRRQRIGLVLANKLHPRGLAFLGHHAMGRVRASLRRASG